MAKSFNEWLKEGEALYDGALGEYRRIESQLEELERALGEKQAEVNQIAAIIGKEPVEGNRRITAQILDSDQRMGGMINPATGNPSAAIARAITGRGLGR